MDQGMVWLHDQEYMLISPLQSRYRVLAHFPPADTYESNADVKDVSGSIV